MQKKTLRLTTRGGGGCLQRNQIFNQGSLGGAGGEAIWRIVRTSEKTLATPLAFFLALLKRNR